MTDLIGVKQVAEILGLTTNTVHRYHREGRIPASVGRFDGPAGPLMWDRHKIEAYERSTR